MRCSIAPTSIWAFFQKTGAVVKLVLVKLDNLQLTGQNLGRVFNLRIGHDHTVGLLWQSKTA